jgi:NDP-sugar pyrophosphorylase family protein
MQLVIPMSGMGKRFIDKGYKLPKPLIPISGKPMVQHVVEMFPGVEEILFIVNKQHFEEQALDLEHKLNEIAPGCEIAVIAPHKFGPAWAIRRAKPFINTRTPVVINYCDFACTWNFSQFREQLHTGINGLIATYSGFHPHMLKSTEYAYLRLDEDGFLDQIQEKQSFTVNPMDEPASSGTYGFGTGQILLDAVDVQISNNDSYNNEFYSSLTYKNMIESGQKIRNFQIEKYFQWGTPEDFEEFKVQKDFFTFKSQSQISVNQIDRIEILAAGAGQRFLNEGFKELKPFLTLGNTFLALEALSALGGSIPKKGILLRDDVVIPRKFEKSLANNKISVRTVKGFTRGQAESARLVLNNEVKGNCVVGTCDSLVFPKSTEKYSELSGKTLGVWVTRPSAFAKLHPEQFGWVSLNEKNEVLESWVKTLPESQNQTFVITGTFFFGNSLESGTLLEEFLSYGVTVNNEYYLDSVIDFAKNKGWKIVGLFPEWFVSLGTPDEYKTYLYWESLFDARKDLLVNDINE